MDNEHNWVFRKWYVHPVSLHEEVKIEFEYRCNNCGGEKLETFTGMNALKEYKRLASNTEPRSSNG